MNDDKAFAAWALFVIGAPSLVVGLVLAGASTLPSGPTLAADIALGLTVRFAYKWVGGFDWADWSLAGDASREASATGDLHAGPDGTATAMG